MAGQPTTPITEPQPTGMAFIDKIQLVIPCNHTDRPSIGTVGNHWFDAESGESIPGEDEMKLKTVLGPRGDALVRTFDPPLNTLLEVSVTPGRYFQGHNAFASSDLLGLCVAVVTDLATRLELELSPETLAILHSGDFRLRRVDVTAMIELPNHQAVRTMLKQAEYARHKRLRSRPMIYQNTILFRGSKYSFKLYDKYSELQDPEKWGHGCTSECRERVHEWSKNKIRAEMTIREEKLKQLGKLNLARNWIVDTPTNIVREQLSYLGMNWDCDLPPELVNSLPHELYQYYYAIKGGAKPNRCWKSRTTVNKYQQMHSRLYEVDYNQHLSVVDLKTMDFAQIPAWAAYSEDYFQT